MTLLRFWRVACLLLSLLPLVRPALGNANETNTTVTMQDFKIGVGVPNAVPTTAECTADETEWIETKFAEYTVALARLFFRDTTVDLAGNFTEVGNEGFDWKAFDDYNTYEKQKFDAQARQALKVAGDAPLDNLDPSDPFLKTANSTTNNEPNNNLNTYPHASGVLDPHQTHCSTNTTFACVTVDFNRTRDGTPLIPGQYVSDEWRDDYGLTISARGIGSDAFTPLKRGPGLHQARIFDSSNPGKEYPEGNEELGSPNEKCKPKGPGKGEGGEPEDTGESDEYDDIGGNCMPLGNILIIQEHEQAMPLAHRMGGEFVFSFDRPVKLDSIGLLDITTGRSSMEVVTSDGEKHLIQGIKKLQSNGFQEVVIGKLNVVKLVVYMPESAAVTDLKFCVDLCPYEEEEAVTDSDRRSLRLGAKASDSFSLLENGHRALDQDKIVANMKADERKLKAYWKHRFVYGAMNSYQCRFCGPDTVDHRRKQRNLRSLLDQTDQDDEREFLISAMESVMSFGLTVDLSWSLKGWLQDRNIDYGCFGDGQSLSAVFELVFFD